MTSLDSLALRRAFGSFMTGVTVVTTRNAAGEPVGFAANSFSSVSLDPPLLLVCPGKFLSSYDSFATCLHFAVNVLAEGQEEVANTFAGYKGDRFARVAHREDALGNILVDGAVAQFSCRTHDVVDAGDHAILIGEVQGVSHDAGRGLGYAGGRFFSLGLERAALEPSGNAALFGAIIALGDDVLLEATDRGFRPPQVVAEDRENSRQRLCQDVAGRGQPVTLGPAYSVFNDGNTQCSYFLATANGGGTTGFTRCPVAEIPDLKFASSAIRDMMMRYAVETRTRSFGLYIGDARRGDVHQSQEGT
ncbi:p-hydroxyphenylacetate 3-hydroxylase, reductase component [Roseovarius sp. THAF9]|uniref:flavin reductase family protein n=1 Tax=Roseovarius sp. THAF9 TaxID=2587847 RepID=UPI001268BF9A|nr:flavin reductase family protein [Roseovarius sp. THAF9]QFT93940.1 p-hydroxyphenylacetate 3-hydroxylase, reductase component [Roseovarius sp. THAF9]